jgi:polar amino acid transport system substrate-binding protein
MKRVLIAAMAASLILAACGSDAADEPTTTEAVAETVAPDAGAETSAAEATETTAAAEAKDCAAGKTITEGTLTIATGEPAFPPYVIDDKPESGEGFEAAVAAAVARELGFEGTTKWVRTAFDAAISPGPKDFDFNLQQYTITEERRAAVDFSEGYYSAPQAIFGLADGAVPATMADLQKLKIGVAAGTTSLTFAEETIKPESAVQVFNDNAAVKTALESKSIDAVVADLPTALYITGVEIEGTKVYGQIAGSGTDQFGMLLAKDNPLTECVNLALQALKTSGELETITTKWMSEYTAAPVIG